MCRTVLDTIWYDSLFRRKVQVSNKVFLGFAKMHSEQRLPKYFPFRYWLWQMLILAVKSLTTDAFFESRLWSSGNILCHSMKKKTDLPRFTMPVPVVFFFTCSFVEVFSWEGKNNFSHHTRVRCLCEPLYSLFEVRRKMEADESGWWTKRGSLPKCLNIGIHLPV